MTTEEIEKAFAGIESGLQKRETYEGPYCVLDELDAVAKLRHEMAVMARMISIFLEYEYGEELPDSHAGNSLRERAEAELKGR